MGDAPSPGPGYSVKFSGWNAYAHIDVGTSWSFNDSLYVGAAGYFFRQVSPDTGGSARLGDFRSQVAGAGPQIGWSLQLGGIATDFNVRGYKEFAAQNRPEGWNAWLTFAISPKAPETAPAAIPTYHK